MTIKENTKNEAGLNEVEILNTLLATYKKLPAAEMTAFHNFLEGLIEAQTDKQNYADLIKLGKKAAGIVTHLDEMDRDILNKQILDLWMKARENFFKDHDFRKTGAITRWDVTVADIQFHHFWWETNEVLNKLIACGEGTLTEAQLNDFDEHFERAKEVMQGEMSYWQWLFVENEIIKRRRVIGNRLTRSSNEDFGVWLRSVRKSKNLTLNALEEMTGISASYVNRIENGKRKQPSFAVAEKLAIALDVPKSEFLVRLGAEMPEAPMSNSIIDWLIVQDARLGTMTLNETQKQALIDLLKAIETSEWTAESKLSEGIQIVHYVDIIKQGGSNS